jgi:hypothetical protein
MYKYFCSGKRLGSNIPDSLCEQMKEFEGKKIRAKVSVLLTEHHDMKIYWGSGCITPLILEFSTRWRWSVSQLRPFYPS